MKAVLDACVLYPTVMRALLLGAAEAGQFTPVWSPRLLEEWARAAERRGEGPLARTEIALLSARFPRACQPERPDIAARLVLPDENDLHVLALAIGSSADAIITLNAQDFPRGTLAGEGLTRRDPDGFLWELASHAPEPMARVAESVRAEAERLSGQPQPLKALLKRARLPRLAKLLAPG